MNEVPADIDLTRSHARSHIERGWKVFLLAKDGSEGKIPPTNCERCHPRFGTCHDGKTCDCLLCHGFYAATDDLGRFERMLERLPAGYLAVRTGSSSRLLVIDAEATAANSDEPTGLEVIDSIDAWTAGAIEGLPHTLTARSVSGGLHYFYRIPDGVGVLPSKNRILPSVDVKCEGGYVGAVGSRKQTRRWVDESVPIATLPADFMSWYRRAKGRGGSGGFGGDRPDGYDFREFVADGCPDGHRDYFFNDYAFQLRKKGYDKHVAFSEIFAQWERAAQPPDARYEMPWHHVEYKIDRVWNEIEPDEQAIGGTSWPGVLQPNVDGITQVTRAVLNEPPEFDTDLTATGNSHRYVRLFKSKALYVPGLGWHLWDGNVWQRDEVDDIFDSTLHVLRDIQREQAEAGETPRANDLQNWYKSSSSMDSRSALLKGAAADPRMKTLADSLDADPYLLVVQNGTLDLRTRQRRDSEPEDRNTQRAGVLYDPDARCPMWEAHVKLVTGFDDKSPDPNLAKFVQRWCGYTLTGLAKEQKFFFGYGDGSNGKNVLMETLLGILGTYGVRSSSKLLLSDANEHETVIARLAGARMAFIDETPKGVVNEARLKELTGSKRVTARLMKKDYFDFEMRAKLWIAGNNKPRVRDTSKGFWRRLDLVPFDVAIPDAIRNKTFDQVLRDEYSGILNWCLEGLRDYLKDGLEQPTRVKKAGDDYQDEENIFAQFVRDTFVQVSGPEDVVWQPNNLLHYLYVQWCKSQGMQDRLIPDMQRLANDWHRAGFKREEKTRKARQGHLSVEKYVVQRGWVGPRPIGEVAVHLVWHGDQNPR